MGRRQISIVIVLFLFFYPTFLAAQDKPSTRTTYTLEQIIERVTEQSELIQAKKLSVQGMDAEARQARAWHNPSVAAELGRIKDPSNHATTYDIRITQPLVFPGKLGAQGEVFERGKDMLETQAADLTNLLSLEASYYAYAYQIAEIQAAEITSRIKRISLMRTYMRSQAYASPAKIIQRNIVSNQLYSLQKNLNSALANAESSWQKLNIYLNQDRKAEVETPWLVHLDGIDEKSFIDRVLKGNRKLKVRHLLLARLEAELSVEKRVPLPDVSVSAFYRNETLIHPGANEFYGGAVSIPIPILNANRAGVEAAQKRLDAAKAENEFIQREVLQNARSLLADYSHKRKLLDNFDEKQIPTLKRQMQYADRELKLGRIDLLSYLELELKTHEAIRAFYETQLELVSVITQMIYLMGESVTYKGKLDVF